MCTIHAALLVLFEGGTNPTGRLPTHPLGRENVEYDGENCV